MSAFDFGPVIDAYSRAQALADGMLIDVSDVAREAGLRHPCAITAAVNASCVAWTSADNDRKGGTCQDREGRLWDVLWMLRCELTRSLRSSSPSSAVAYSLYIVPRDGDECSPQRRSLKAVVHGGDRGEPVITIMLPGED